MRKLLSGGQPAGHSPAMVRGLRAFCGVAYSMVLFRESFVLRSVPSSSYENRGINPGKTVTSWSNLLREQLYSLNPLQRPIVPRALERRSTCCVGRPLLGQGAPPIREE